MSYTIPTSFLRKPFIWKYSIVDIVRTLLALLFIFLIMSSLTIYLHTQIQERSLSLSKKIVEYVTTTDNTNTLEPKKVHFVVDSTFSFPIHYKDKISTGYILRDVDTDIKYIYTNTGGENGSSTLTRYWEK